jgi:hypothetical protein
MTLEDVLKVEYEQQCEQYRWIGSQQNLVVTFYTATVAAFFAVIGVFFRDAFPRDNNSWFPWFLLFLGFMGILISFALISSRAMQHRTAIYVQELLIQMTEQSNPGVNPAIRFRAVPTSRFRFLPLDTINIAISLAFVFGVSLSMAAITLFTGITHWLVAASWFVLVVILACLGVCCILPCLLREKIERARERYNHSRDVTAERWAEHLRDNFGLN